MKKVPKKKYLSYLRKLLRTTETKTLMPAQLQKSNTKAKN